MMGTVIAHWGKEGSNGGKEAEFLLLIERRGIL